MDLTRFVKIFGVDRAANHLHTPCSYTALSKNPDADTHTSDWLKVKARPFESEEPQT